ncbi:MAG: hypothetical protein JWM11_7960 [Planctomycetaceae bacterium]|nr:hypothetical protein [Planctomycetaceae bacterium]
MKRASIAWSAVICCGILLQHDAWAQSRSSVTKKSSAATSSRSRLEDPEFESDSSTRSRYRTADPFDEEAGGRIRQTSQGDTTLPPLYDYGYDDPPPIRSDLPPLRSYSLDPIVEAPSTAASYSVEPNQLWAHRSGVWADFLFAKVRGTDVTYATPVDGTLSTSVPLGPQAVTGFDYQPGYRIGGAWAIDCGSSITANYMSYQTSTEDNAHLAGGGGTFFRADTVLPGTLNVAADSLTAKAFNYVDIQTADLNFKSLLWYGDCYSVNYVLGAKYSHLDQQFNARYSVLGKTNVDTEVDFDGAGPRVGLEGERFFPNSGFMTYSKGALNLLCGGSSAKYLQTNVFTGIQGQTSLSQGRVVFMPELELGAGWQNCTGRFRVTAGYYVAGWFNMLSTPEYLSTVRTDQNSFEHQIKTLTLDGMTLRAEYRY